MQIIAQIEFVKCNEHFVQRLENFQIYMSAMPKMTRHFQNHNDLFNSRYFCQEHQDQSDQTLIIMTLSVLPGLPDNFTS